MKNSIEIFLFIFKYSLITALISCSEEVKTYQLNVTIDPINSGEVTPKSSVYEEGSSVNLLASPNEGYTFSSWSGNISSEENPLLFQINSDINITAKFEEIDLNSNDSDNDGIIDNVDNCVLIKPN